MVQMTAQRDIFDAQFDGSDYNDKRDRPRLNGQIRRVYRAMCSSRWMTLDDVVEITGDPHASVSAQMRHLRKEKFGSNYVQKRYKGRGLFEYRLLPSGRCQK
tara:strand:- start:1090 stop:1395 length:306 start_codon:yes stop_codon:yes gene_type:complete